MMPETFLVLRGTVRNNLRKRLAMTPGCDQLDERNEREVVEVCALMINHYQYGYERRQVDDLSRRNAVLREAVAIHRAKARVYAKAATTWEHRFNRLRKQSERGLDEPMRLNDDGPDYDGDDS